MLGCNYNPQTDRFYHKGKVSELYEQLKTLTSNAYDVYQEINSQPFLDEFGDWTLGNENIQYQESLEPKIDETNYTLNGNTVYQLPTDKLEQSKDTLLQGERDKRLQEQSKKFLDAFEKQGVELIVQMDDSINANAEIEGSVIRVKTLQEDTLPHEFAHAYVDLLGDLSKEGVDQLKGTDLWNTIKNRYPDLSEERLGKEVLVTAIGQKYVEIANKLAWKQWLLRAWNKLARVLGISIDQAEDLAMDLYNQTLKPFSGKLFEGKQEQRSVVKPRQGRIIVFNGASNIAIDQTNKVIEISNKIEMRPDGTRWIDGKLIPRRVSQVAKEDGRQENIYGNSDRKEDELAAQKGTILHKYNEIFLEGIADGNSTSFREVAYKFDDGSIKMYDLLDEADQKEFAMLVQAEIAQEADKQEVYGNLDLDYFILKNRKNEAFYKELFDGIKAMYDRIELKGAKRGGVGSILLEQLVYDENPPQTSNKTALPIAGTIDVSVIYNDGSEGIYDYKGTFFQSTRLQENGKWVDKVEGEIYKDSKIRDNEIQLGEYARIKKKVYGATAVHETRIVPIRLGVRYDKSTNKKDDYGFDILEISQKDENKKGGRRYLYYLPVNEIPEDPVLARVVAAKREELSKLRVKVAKLKGQSQEDTETSINVLNAQIRDLVLMQSLYREYKDLALRLDLWQSNLNNQAYSIGELVHIQGVISQYKAMFDNLLKPDEKGIVKGLEGTVNVRPDVTYTVRDLYARTYEVDKQINAVMLHTLTRRYDDVTLTSPIKLGGKITTNLNAMSDLEEPVIQMLQAELREAWKEIDHGVAADKANPIDYPAIKGLKTIVKELDAWRDKIADTKNLFDRNTGNLITKHTKEFYDFRKNALEQQDIDTMLETFIPSARWERSYEDRKLRMNIWYNNHFDTITAQKKMALWVEQNDLSVTDSKPNNPRAWLNRKNELYFDIHPDREAEWANPQYVSLTDTEKEFYNYVSDTMQYALSLVGVKKKENFLPAIRMDIGQMLSDLPLQDIPAVLAKNFKDSLSVEYSDVDGRLTSDHVPIYFTEDTMPDDQYNKLSERLKELKDKPDKDPQDEATIKTLENTLVNAVRASEKSRDIFSSVLLFAKMANSHSALKRREQYQVALRSVLADKSYIAEDYFGRVVYEQGITDSKGNKVFKMVKPDSNEYLSVYDKFVSRYFYGVNTVDEDVVFNLPLMGTVSGKALFQKGKAFLQAKSLAFNMTSALVSAVSGDINLRYMAAKQQFFNSEDLSFVQEMFRNKDLKYFMLSDYWNIDDDNWEHRKARELREDGVKKYVDSSSAMILQRHMEGFVTNQLTIALMKNYGLKEIGIDSSGKPRYELVNIKKLPDDADKRSLFDRYSVKDGRISIDGLNAKTFEEFRNLAKKINQRARGMVSEQDISAYQTTVLGQALGSFRSWIVGTAKERFGELRYDKDLKEYEIGRYRAAYQHITEWGADKENNLVKDLFNLTQDFILGGGLPFMGKREWKITGQVKKQFLKKLRVTNPTHSLLLKLDSGQITEEEALNEVSSARLAQLKALVTELRSIALITGLFLVASGDWDEDGTSDLNENFAGRYLLKALDRLQNELTFYLNINSTVEIIKSPVPLTSVLVDMTRFLTELVDESRDVVFGENSKNDKAGIFFYAVRLFPIVKIPFEMYDLFLETEQDKKNKLPKQGSHEIQLLRYD